MDKQTYNLHMHDFAHIQRNYRAQQRRENRAALAWLVMILIVTTTITTLLNLPA